MKIESLIEILGADFFTGVPDSLLKPLCNYLMKTYGIDPRHHVIGVNEGNCVALAAGYHMATGKVPVVYMQNSGEGNVINPVASLLNDKVYAIPVLFIIGWRGRPGVHDEPQHIYQGQVTRTLLDDMDIENSVITSETSEEELRKRMNEYRDILAKGKSVALVVEKDALTYNEKIEYKNNYTMKREEIVWHITNATGEDPVISTTGKASRELFENRTTKNQSHKYDFLTVGGMGHAATIALGIAINKPEQKIWCIDGDGAAIMHMGAMAVIGANAPKNLVHILINNEAHETVGGLPTVAKSIDMTGVAKSCKYPYAISVDTFEDFDRELAAAKTRNELSFIEVKCSIGARKDLGRPTTTAIENKTEFMKYLKTL